ncbi:hypothetical protein ACT1WK_08110 [Lactobacillus gasseri]
MARKIKQNNDPWLTNNPTIGIIGWDGENTFKIIRRCKINYSLSKQDWIVLAKGMILRLSNCLKENLIS